MTRTKTEMNLMRMFVRAIKKKQKVAFVAWKRWSYDLGFQCRLELLRQEYTQKMFKTALSGSMKYTLTDQKHLKRAKLNLILKAWREMVLYNNHVRKTNRAISKFESVNTRYTLYQCFSALRLHKEDKKTEILT